VEEEGLGFGSQWGEHAGSGPLPGGLTPPRGSMLLPNRRGSGAGGAGAGVSNVTFRGSGSSMRYGGFQESLSPLRASGRLGLDDYY
jgi:hypothetical protein